MFTCSIQNSNLPDLLAALLVFKLTEQTSTGFHCFQYAPGLQKYLYLALNINLYHQSLQTQECKYIFKNVTSVNICN